MPSPIFTAVVAKDLTSRHERIKAGTPVYLRQSFSTWRRPNQFYDIINSPSQDAAAQMTECPADAFSDIKEHVAEDDEDLVDIT